MFSLSYLLLCYKQESVSCGRSCCSDKQLGPEFIHSTIHSSHSSFLSTCWVPGSRLAAYTTVVIFRRLRPCLHEVHDLVQ